MCINLLRQLYVLVLLGLLNGAIGQYYANQFPYNRGTFVYSSLGDSSVLQADGGDDLLDAFTNKAFEKGNAIVMTHDTVKFIDKDNVSKEHDVAHRRTGASVDDQRLTIGQDVEEDKSHNRKHTKSGFHNTYSRDEKGSNSSYYEDSDDHGGQLVYDKRHGVQGSNHDARYHDKAHDGHARDKVDDRFHGHNEEKAKDRRMLVERDQGDRRDYHDRFNRDRVETNRVQQYPSHSSYSPIAEDDFDRSEPILNFVRRPSRRYRQWVSILFYTRQVQ